MGRLIVLAALCSMVGCSGGKTAKVYKAKDGTLFFAKEFASKADCKRAITPKKRKGTLEQCMKERLEE